MIYRLRIDPVAQRQIDQFATYLRDYSEDFAIECRVVKDSGPRGFDEARIAPGAPSVRQVRRECERGERDEDER